MLAGRGKKKEGVEGRFAGGGERKKIGPI